ncbi:MAG: hypothetical protein JW837_13865 [Sedimentisphaerales bacterium]|nr:hypothetical protein [Sedimentisphaerales bacterium]
MSEDRKERTSRADISSVSHRSSHDFRDERDADRRQIRSEIARPYNRTQKNGSDSLSPRTRVNKVVPEKQTSVIDTVVVNDEKYGEEVGVHRYRLGRSSYGSSHVTYHDRPHVIHHGHHDYHSFIDRHRHLCRRSIWPGFRYRLYYDFGPWFTFRYFYPYYHRKYVFVSLGGYWPLSYRYRRYYWYGYHPYVWYGYYPIAREIEGDTYNYYTYNYYGDGNAAVSASPQDISGIAPVDHNTFADVREIPAQQEYEEPQEITLADTYFEDAVKAFEIDNYELAAEKFGQAMALAPDDMILPFAYSQALFAYGLYSQAAVVLREAMVEITPDKEGVFYPRGLYSNDDILFEQINQLVERAELYSFDADLQLLLGYHLLGIGKLDEALEPLQYASLDMENAVAATALLNVLEKIRAENNNPQDTDL